MLYKWQESLLPLYLCFIMLSICFAQDKATDQTHTSDIKNEGLENLSSAEETLRDADKYTLEEILSMLVSRPSHENETSTPSNISDEVLEATLAHIIGLLHEDENKESKDLILREETIMNQPQPENVEGLPQLQFLEPDLGPAVLPLQVPHGYFVPFIPRKAFGVVNGVSRPSHGHASFYRYRPRGLVDVRNSPAYGFLLGGP